MVRYIHSENAGASPFHLPTSCTPEGVSEVLMKVALILQSQVFRISFFYLGFLSQITFTNHRTAGEGAGHFFNSSLPLPSNSQTLRHWPCDYCRELTSPHMVSQHISLTTKLYNPRALTINLNSLRISSN